MHGWLGRFIFTYVYSTPGLAEQGAAASLGAEQAATDERDEQQAAQRRDAAEGERV